MKHSNLAPLHHLHICTHGQKRPHAHQHARTNQYTRDKPGLGIKLANARTHPHELVWSAVYTRAGKGMPHMHAHPLSAHASRRAKCSHRAAADRAQRRRGGRSCVTVRRRLGRRTKRGRPMPPPASDPPATAHADHTRTRRRRRRRTRRHGSQSVSQSQSVAAAFSHSSQ